MSNLHSYFDYDKVYTLEPNVYLHELEPEQKVNHYWCLGIRESPIQEIILGAKFMKNYDIFFDRKNPEFSVDRNQK